MDEFDLYFLTSFLDYLTNFAMDFPDFEEYWKSIRDTSELDRFLVSEIDAARKRLRWYLSVSQNLTITLIEDLQKVDNTLKKHYNS